jgi:hypothetical protein
MSLQGLGATGDEGRAVGLALADKAGLTAEDLGLALARLPATERPAAREAFIEAGGDVLLLSEAEGLIAEAKQGITESNIRGAMVTVAALGAGYLLWRRFR